MARTMLNESKLSNNFWKEATYMEVYIMNRGKIRVNNSKTPYGLWKGRPSIVKYFKVFERKCYIERDEEAMGKFDFRAY